jgi:hypothetical protein
MNRIHPARTGAAVAITIVIGYALCTLVFVVFPDSSVAFLNSLFHGLDFRKLQPAAGGFSAAGFGAVLAVWAIYGFLLGALYGWVSNRLGR